MGGSGAGEGEGEGEDMLPEGRLALLASLDGFTRGWRFACSTLIDAGNSPTSADDVTSDVAIESAGG
jgi:hypothetical protein